MSFSIGNSPLWKNYIFQDLFLDGYVENHEIKRIPSIDKLKKPAQLLSISLDSLLNSDHCNVYKAKELNKINQVLHALEDAIGFANRLSQIKTANEFETFLHEILRVIQRLQAGKICILPGGFKKDNNRGEIMWYVVARSDESRSTYKFAIINTGEGKDYHYSTYTSDYLHNPPNIKMTKTMVIDDIEADRILDTSFWFLLYRLIVYPSKNNTARHLYELLLPALNNKPLYLNINESDPDIELTSLPKNNDPTLIHATLEAIRYSISVLLSNLRAKSICFMIHYQLIYMLKNDLNSIDITNFSTSQATICDISCRTLARIAANEAESSNSSISTTQLIELKEFLDEIYQHTNLLLNPLLDDDNNNNKSAIKASESIEELPNLPPKLYLSKQVEWQPLPLFDRIRNDENIEHLAGEKKKTPIFRPIEFTLIPEKATNFHQVQLALRHCDHICTLLSYQAKTISNTFLHRVAVIQHVFLRVIPLPLPHNSPLRESQCFWAQPLKYSDQVDILRLLMMISRHFTACALSLNLTRSFDATRVLTMSCMATIADAVIRIRASDIPSRFSLHYDGKYQGKTPFEIKPYGFDISLSFAKQSQVMQFTDPNMVACRTKVLDYFHQQRQDIDNDRLVFNWEKDTTIGNGQLLMMQLCWDMGFPYTKEACSLYFSGELTEIIDFFPEFEYYRDIIFIFKFMMAPTAEAFPPIMPYNQKAARLYWTYTKNGFVVRAFKDRILKCISADINEDEKKRKVFFSNILSWFLNKLEHHLVVLILVN